MEDSSGCAFFAFLPQVVKPIGPVRGGDVNDVAAIRREVCRECRGLTPDGFREARRHARRALDAYLLEAVDVIEEAVGKPFGPAAARLHASGGAVVNLMEASR